MVVPNLPPLSFYFILFYFEGFKQNSLPLTRSSKVLVQECTESVSFEFSTLMTA